ncbi:rhomboid family intramembrane serine protease [Metabacillus sp. KIGAM252]|uniref:Rhomboid family intramembrane serine protease n=1 Tax=Metabacillus flavus TaxID=2823519 RepID=A0ABS5LG12_9BACI|nr:rhomboid family intramembrane serine protease [Metabacillus flavus]MBS2969687.1 rhomboid family intramembrane serine protease [Metabacillus flavus]
MALEQDVFYWSIIGQLMDRKYRFVTMAEDQNEVWLESQRVADFQLVRFVRMDADWGNRLEQDMERAASMFDEIRKDAGRKSMNILNIYISAFAPVDDWEHLVEKPYSHGNIVLKNVLIYDEIRSEGIISMEDMLSVRLEKELPEITDYEELHSYRAKVIEKENTRVTQERKLFEYGKPRFTKILLAIQIIVFILMELAGGSQNNQTLVNFGAKFNPYIMEGEWWRLITPMFLHIGFIHLLMNSMALYFIGEAVEKMFGSARFLMIYFFSGIMGTLASFAFNTSISAGASGAIFGCFGALLYLGVVQRDLFLRTIGPNILVVIGINLALGFTISNIDNAGHIGGLIGGMAAAFAVQLPSQSKSVRQGLAAAAGLVLAVSLAAFGYSRW